MDMGTAVTTLALVVLGTIGLIAFGIIFGLFFKGIDRKFFARMQGRVGPPLIQPFRDVRKLFVKENIVPDNAIPWVFNLAPLVGLAASVTILLYIPIGGFEPLAGAFGDLILVLYLLIIPSLALVIGGFSSGSPYATIGAQREMATMIAYEFPLAIIIITIAWRLSRPDVFAELSKPEYLDTSAINVFSLTTITTIPIWNVVGILGFIGVILLLLALIIVTPAELSKIPFDSPEAETEIGGGLLVEYSGRNLAMFYLTDAVKTVVMASIIVALFFPYNLTQIGALSAMDGEIAGYAINFVFFLIKVILVITFSVTLIRVAVARLKIDQIVYTYWVPITLMALVGLICIMWDWQVMNNWADSYKTVFSMLGLG